MCHSKKRFGAKRKVHRSDKGRALRSAVWNMYPRVMLVCHYRSEHTRYYWNHQSLIWKPGKINLPTKEILFSVSTDELEALGS